MTKLLLVMVTVFALAVPSVAIAGEEGGGGGDRGGNNVGRNADQTNVARGVSGNVQQNNQIAGRDAHSSQTIRQGDTINRHTHNRFGHGGGHVNGHGGHNGHGGVGGGNVTSFGHGGGHGGGVGGVTLAATGADAWILALVGGVALAGGLGLLVAQRRGRLSA
jgi:LPXTG-motif cell wall-anchored protein